MFNKFIILINSKEFKKFFIFGLSAFAFDFILLQLVLRLFNIPEEEHLKQTLANVFSTSIAIIYNYTIQRKWAFKSEDRNIAKEAGKFISVQLFNLVVFQVIFFSIVNYILPSWSSKIIVTAFQILVSFFLYKYFVFKKQVPEKV